MQIRQVVQGKSVGLIRGLVIPLETNGPMAISFGQLVPRPYISYSYPPQSPFINCFEILRVRKRRVRYKNAYDKIKFERR